MKTGSISKVAMWSGIWKDKGKCSEGHPGTSWRDDGLREQCTWVALVEWTQGESHQPLVCFTCWVLSIIASASAISFWFIPQRLATFVWHRWWTFIPHAERKNAVGKEQEKKSWGLHRDILFLGKKVRGWHCIWYGLWIEALSWHWFCWTIYDWFYWLENTRVEEGALPLQSRDLVSPFPAALVELLCSLGWSLSCSLSLKKGNG